MSYFKAKMCQIRFLVGALLQTPLGELTTLPDPLAGFKGPTSKEKEGIGRGREWRGAGKEREAEENGDCPPTIFGLKVTLKQSWSVVMNSLQLFTV